MALRTIVPLLAVVPFLALLVWFTHRAAACGRSIASRSAIAQRSPTLLEPVAEHGLPREVQPLVDALNGLLDRLGHALDAQRTSSPTPRTSCARR